MAEIKSNAKKVSGGLKSRGKKLCQGEPIGMPKPLSAEEGSEALRKRVTKGKK
jgi:hypothetical protein